MGKILKEDFDRNIQYLKVGKDLDIPLRTLKNYLRLSNGWKWKIQSSSISKVIPLPHRERIYSQRRYKIEIKKCVHCGKEFEGKLNQRVCSKRCKRKRLNELNYIRHAKRMKEDWQYALKIRLRDNFRDAVRYYYQTGKLRRHVRSDKYIDYAGIIQYLGPCPGNRREWHIDHIKPLIAFDFSDTFEIKKAFAKENLRWLSASENLKKGIKI